MKRTTLFSVILFILTSCSERQKTQFSEKDVAEIKQMMRDYRSAWMDADSVNVLNKLSGEIRMIRPGDLSTPIIGKKNLTDFWFPSSDISYPIYMYEISNEEIQGSGDLAFLQGTSRLSWCTLENGVSRDSTTNISEYLTIVKREEGEWKIFRQIYNMKNQKYSR